MGFCFCCVAFRQGTSVELQSKSGQSLTRYFPELVAALGSLKADQFVLDGEIIVVVKDKLSFDDLLQRIHPAASRVAKLAKESPAQLVLFDLLVDAQGKSLIGDALAQRRPRLEAFAAKYLGRNPRFLLSPASFDIQVARRWLKTMRGQLDGLIAKPLDAPYSPGERTMQKIKNLRTADCVVGGFRYGAKTKVVGSLLLGLYDAEGLLNHVGFTSSMENASRPALTRKLQALIEPPGFTGRAPGGPSRWSSERSTEWEPLRPELVVEVRYDHFTSGRFRHGTKLVRWRPDKAPLQCRMDQVEIRTKSPLNFDRQARVDTRVFLLSPARIGGPRSMLLLREQAELDLAVRLRKGTATIGEVYAFISGLYFRGKLAYSSAFGSAPQGIPPAMVIVPGMGLVEPDTVLTHDQLRAIGTVPVEADNTAYSAPLLRDALLLDQRAGPGCRYVLLGSIATEKYTRPLIEVFGERLLFPAEFVGRGDMSRGGLDVALRSIR